jgi:hypothetical protein
MTKVLSGFALLLASLIIVVPNVHAQEHPVLNNATIKQLTKTATTQAQHRAIAAYYRQRSEELVASSKEHMASAEARAKNPTFAALEVKHGFTFGLGASHCRHLANADPASAKRAESLASLHERLAELP